MAEWDGAFGAFLNALQARGQSEAQQFAVNQAQKMQAFSMIGDAISNIRQNVQNDQIQKGQYQYASEQSGIFPTRPEDVMSSPLPSQTQTSTMKNQTNIQNQIAQNTQEISKIQTGMQGNGQGALQPGYNYGSNFSSNNGYWNQPKPILDRLNALIESNKQLNQTYSNLQQHQQTPQYQQQVKSEKWNAFTQQYPQYSDVWFRAMNALQGQQQTPEQKEQMKLDFEQKKNDMELSRVQAEKQTPSAPPQKTASIDWTAEKKQVDADPDLLENPDKLTQAHALINQYAQKTGNITDVNRLNAIKNQYQSDLAKIREQPVQQPQQKQKPQTPADKNQAILQQMLKKYDTGD